MRIRSVPVLFAVLLLSANPAAADDGTSSVSYDFQQGSFPGVAPHGEWTNVEGWGSLCIEKNIDGTCLKKGYPGQAPGVLYKVGLSSIHSPLLGPATMDLNVSVSLATIDVADNVVLKIASSLGMNWAGTDPDTGLYFSKTAIIGNEGDIEVSGSIYSNTGLLIEGDGQMRLLGGTISTPGGLVNSSTLRGAGLLTGAGMTNSGLIQADYDGAVLQLNVYDSGVSVNAGTLRATSGGILKIAMGGTTGFLANNNGIIEAAAGSAVELHASLRGGELHGDGAFGFFGTGFIENIRNYASLDIAPGANLYVNQTGATEIENFGQITLRTDAGTAAPTRLILNGDIGLGGSGTLLLQGAKSQVTGQGAAPVLRIGAGNTVKGAGVIGTLGAVNTVSRIDNAGVIRASIGGDRLLLRAGGLDGIADISNSGFMEATNGGTLEILNSDVGNSGQIRASEGSTVDLNGARVTGGILDTEGTGVIRVRSTAALAGLTNRGTLKVEYGDMSGTLTNNGSMLLAYTPAAGAYAGLGVRGDVVLTGNGVLEMTATPADSNSARIRYASGSAGGLLTNDAGHTIQGSGSIGYEGGVGVLNRGLIVASKATPLDIFPAAGKGGFVNEGTVRALAGSTLSVWSSFNNYIAAGKTLEGGRYEIAGTLRTPFGTDIVSNASAIVLDGAGSSFISGTSGTTSALANLAGNLAAGGFEIRHGRDFNTAGSFSNAGALTVGSGSTLSVGGAGVYTQTGGKTVVDGTLQAITLFINGGALAGSGSIQAFNIVNSGAFGPGSSPGALTVAGDFTQTSSGILEMELAGTLAGSQYDHFSVQGAFHADGTLLVKLIDGFDPLGGESFDLLDWTTLTGAFATIGLPQLRAGLSWDTSRLYLDGVLAVAGAAVPLPGTIWGLLAGLGALLAYARRSGAVFRRGNPVAACAGSCPSMPVRC